MKWVGFGEYVVPGVGKERKEEVKKHTGINMDGNHIMRGKEFLVLCTKQACRCTLSLNGNKTVPMLFALEI